MMEKGIAKMCTLSYICPICEYLHATENGIITHLVDNHEDKEAWWLD